MDGGPSRGRLRCQRRPTDVIASEEGLGNVKQFRPSLREVIRDESLEHTRELNSDRPPRRCSKDNLCMSWQENDIAIRLDKLISACKPDRKKRNRRHTGSGGKVYRPSELTQAMGIPTTCSCIFLSCYRTAGHVLPTMFSAGKCAGNVQ
jgi:hypothetical protein